MRNSLYMTARREGSMVAVDYFCERMKLEWIKPMKRYTLFCWFFQWYSHSKIGSFLERRRK